MKKFHLSLAIVEVQSTEISNDIKPVYLYLKQYSTAFIDVFYVLFWVSHLAKSAAKQSNG